MTTPIENRYLRILYLRIRFLSVTTTVSTALGFRVSVCVCVCEREREREREMFYLTTHSTHFIYGYMASDMVKDHSDSEKGNPLPPHRLLLSINSKGSFICTIPQTG